MFREFRAKGYYPENVNSVSYDSANLLFYSGKAVMNPTGTWLLTEMSDQELNFEVGYFAFPSIDGSGISPPAGLGDGLFIARRADEPEAAVKLLDFLTFSDDVARAGLERFSEIPAFPLDKASLNLSPRFRSVVDDFKQTPNQSSFGYNIDVLAPQEFNTVMNDGFQEVLNGQMTAGKQAAALQQAYELARAGAEDAGES
jgi:raffinose/stachyose/melibiose transport system substrate-binding protein